MQLSKYYEKKVSILSNKGNKYIGKIVDYCEPDDNENGKESIILDNPPVELYESDIKTIEIIE